MSPYLAAMPLLDVNWNPSSKDLRVFAALEIVFFGIVAALVYRRTGSVALAGGIAGTAAAVGILGLAVPRAIRYFYLAWMAAAWPVGWVVSHVILGVIYFGLFSLIGIPMRWFAGDPMNRRFDRSASTYWTERTESKSVGRYFRQF